jgi:hypothetical protein
LRSSSETEIFSLAIARRKWRLADEEKDTTLLLDGWVDEHFPGPIDSIF